MIRIGEDRTERLDIVPTQLRVIVTVRPKYACRTCEAGVIQTAAPSDLITGGLPTEGALAQVLIAKYGYHLSLYRLPRTAIDRLSDRTVREIDEIESWQRRDERPKSSFAGHRMSTGGSLASTTKA